VYEDDESTFDVDCLHTVYVQIEVMMDPQPVLLLLGALSILLALFVTCAGDDIFSALLWYQSPKVWIWVSAVCHDSMQLLSLMT